MNKLLPDNNLTPCIILKRLTTEEIERFTSVNRKKQSPSNKPFILSETIQIKQERRDIPTINVQQENQNVQIQTNRIKQENQNSQNVNTIPYDEICRFEDTDVREIKIESDDTPDSNGNTEIYNAINLKKLYCENCVVAFNTFEEYVTHNYFEHKNDKSYSCGICNEQFSLEIHLNIHLTLHVHEICLRSSSSTLPAETQSSPNGTLAMNSRNNINCRSSVTLTNNSFYTNLKEKRKMTEKILSRSTKNFCKPNTSVVFRKKPNLDPFKCTECSYSTVDQNQFLSHSSICSDDTEPYFCCHLCFKSFHTQAALNGHMKYHSVRGEIPKKQKTEIGNKKTNVSVMINQKVIRVKSPIKLFTCKYCSKQFITHHKLHIHCLKHKKQLVCKVCNKLFFFKKSFEKHLLSHKSGALIRSIHQKFMKSKCVSNTTENKTQNNVIQFSCAYCKNHYNSEKSLKRHTTMKHSDLLSSYQNSKTPCQQCNYCSAVITKCNLLRHVRNFHPQVKPIKCYYCSMRFKDKLSMKLHVSESHPK